jgi:S-adenosyl-L-methionine hydrolase (adenosine-forming)
LYIDHYGNAWTGIRAELCDPGMTVLIRGKALPYRRVFSDAEKGEMFWYINSVGLLEIAVNRGSAADLAGLSVGDLVKLSGSPDSRLH